MKRIRLKAAILGLGTFAVGLIHPVGAQQPNTLKYSIAAPPVGAQARAQLGCSVAVDGGLTVVGAPKDDLGGRDSGVVKVFNSVTGALLHVIPNPTPAVNDAFGYSVAISGTRVVVGAPSDGTGANGAACVYVYDLASGSPTLPVATLSNPSPVLEDRFGFSVAISGARVVAGTPDNDTGASDAGSVYVYDLSSGSSTIPVATLNNPSPAVGDFFGNSLVISGTRVVVGAYRDDTGGADAGIAYVFDLANAAPTIPVATLKKSIPAAGDNFGNSVAISGTRVVVGAYFDDTGLNEAGSAYVYDLSSGTPQPTPIATLNNPSPTFYDRFGNSVAISGTRVVVGVYFDDTGAEEAGSAYVYDLSSGTPQPAPVATLNNPTPANNDQFGASVAISGTRVVVGAIYDDTGAYDAGSAYVYDLSSGTAQPAPVATLNNPGPTADDQFGASVAISGTRVVVGAFYDDTGAIGAGSVYVYDLSSGSPTVPVSTLNNPSPAPGDYFGWSVAISGTRVVVGAIYDDTGGTKAGSAYVYDLSSGSPTVPVATLINPSPAHNDQFGASVAISGTRVVVGAIYDDTGAADAGSAYLYDLSSGSPTVPVATLSKPSPAIDDRFGSSVAISGTRVVVGAYNDDTGAANAGSAYVYDLSSGTPQPTPVATLNNPGPAAFDFFGSSVAISGTRVVVGAYNDDTGAANAGSAYVYDLSSGSPTLPVATLNHPSPAVYDGFGNSVAISGMRVVVGASEGAGQTGSAFVYDLSSGTAQPTPVATLNNPSPAEYDSFGISVAIEGSIAVIGTPNDDSPQNDKGSVYVFGPAPADTTGPTGGSFLVSPASPVLQSTTLFADFDLWTDASLPLTYEVRKGASEIIVARSSNRSPNFTLPAGTHSITGRVYDSQGNFTDAGPVTVVVVGPVFIDSPLATEVSTTGSAVPGAGSGAGSDARIQTGAVWTALATPAINDAGQVAYLGKWKAPAIAGGAAAQSGVGIFIDHTLLVKAGQVVPEAGTIGLPDDATFKSFRDPIIDGAGNVSFLASIAGTGISSANDTVVMSNAQTGVLQVLAREGADAPETGGAKFKSFANVSALGSTTGGVLFTASLKAGGGNPKVTAARDTGVWLLPAGGNAVLKLTQEGNPGFSGEETIKSVLALSAVSGSPGQGRGLASGNSVLLRLTLGGRVPRQALARAIPGVITELAGTGTALGGTTLQNATWKTINLPASGNGGQNIAVLGSLTPYTGGTGIGDVKGIYVSTSGGAGWEPLARMTNIAPGFGTFGASYVALSDPVISSTDASVAFMGTVKGGLVRSSDNSVIWWRPEGEEVTLLAREGAHPPGAPNGAKWNTFTSLAFPGGGAGPIFTATLKRGAANGKITAKDDLALYAVDSQRTLHEVMREGQPLANLTGRTVKTFSVLKAVAGTAGVTRAFNDNHQIAAHVTYMDGTNGVVRIEVP